MDNFSRADEEALQAEADYYEQRITDGDTTRDNTDRDEQQGEALKACPFCGRKAGIDEFRRGDDPQPLFAATCEICPVKTYDQFSAQEAARIWNSRSLPELVPEFVRVQDVLRTVSDLCDATQPFVGRRFKKQLQNAIHAVSFSRASIDAVAGESDHDYAVRLARHLMTNCFPVEGWEPLPTLSGVLSQIDNMIAGLTAPKLTMRDLALRHTEQGERAAASSPPAEPAHPQDLHAVICSVIFRHCKDVQLPHGIRGLEDDLTAALLSHFAATTTPSSETAVGGDRAQWLLTQIVRDLPANRDWLDPAVEKEARALAEGRSGKGEGK